MSHPIFDAHLHIINPDYPLIENQGYLPPAYSVEDYQAQAAQLGIKGGVVVSGSFQGFDQTYLKAALQQLGDGFVGVTQLPVDTSNEEILALDNDGVRAVRFNLVRGGSETVEHLRHFARRVFDLAGWHVELYVDCSDIKELEPIIAVLPKVSIDHLGLSRAGMSALVRLAKKGVRVKASGFGRVNFPAEKAIKSLFAANPLSLMFGSDLPSTRAARPFMTDDIALIKRVLGDEASELVLWENGARFYRLWSHDRSDISRRNNAATGE